MFNDIEFGDEKQNDISGIIPLISIMLKKSSPDHPSLFSGFFH